jgi:hypothetical protein
MTLKSNPMNQINLLRQTLKPLLGWHGARLNFLALFLIALLRVKTINLVELATGFRTKTKTDSNYKRLQRFFRDFELDYQQIAQIIVTLMENWYNLSRPLERRWLSTSLPCKVIKVLSHHQKYSIEL